MYKDTSVGCGNSASVLAQEPRNVLWGCVVRSASTLTDCPAKGQPHKALPGFFFGPTAMVALDSRLHGRDATNTQAGSQYPARLAAFPVGTAQDFGKRQWHQTEIDESRHQVNSGLGNKMGTGKRIARPG